MRDDLLEHILAVSRRMAETRALTPLLNYVMDEAIALVGAERGYVVLVHPDGVLDIRVKRGMGGEDLESGEDQVSVSILTRVVGDGEPLVLRDAMNDSRFGSSDSVFILGLRSIMCVPLVSRGDTIGAIYVENRSIRDRFSEADLPPLTLFANQAAVEIENARLFSALQSAHDELEIRVEERTSELVRAKAGIEAANSELQRRNEELQDALSTIKTLSGFVPVCAWCHNKIRNENGQWVRLEAYIEEFSEATVTHGICPDCAADPGKQG
jgi:GAF domain-containing protein